LTRVITTLKLIKVRASVAALDPACATRARRVFSTRRVEQRA
jgi:hypothetical protein